MKKFVCIFVFVFAVLFLPSAPFVLPAAAEGLRAVRPAVLYDAPGTAARPLAILSDGYPLRQISKIDGWRKVITPDNDDGWVAEADLGTGLRAVVTAAGGATVYNAPRAGGGAVFHAQQGVVLNLLTRRGGQWLQVAHADGETGYVAAADVWSNF